ncbi:MAG: VTT domain-containing protein [Rikenellaceae bacterium]
MNILRKIYDWVLKWADSKWGAYALFFLAFAESSFFPIPPDVLLIALCLGLTTRSFRYALIATAGSVAGAAAGYAIGHYAWIASDGGMTQFANFFFNNVPGFTMQVYEEICNWYAKYDFWVVFTAGFTPIPYKVITITSGVFDINFMIFIIASIVSRGARFFIIGTLIWKFGAPIKVFIDKYFNILALAFTVLLIGGFTIIKYIF